MAIIKSFSPLQNLSEYNVFINDFNSNSTYFRITEFAETFTGGKNGFLIEGSECLKESTEIKIEILDVEGNPIYFEPGDGIPEYYEGTSKLISVHVYDDTPIGIGKITILGELKDYFDGDNNKIEVPDDWKGVYNVKWEKEFKINKTLSNENVVRFYKRPTVAISELVKPIFSKTINNATDSGTVNGFPLQPSQGQKLSDWRAGTNYLLQRTSGTWDIDVDESVINISSLSYSPTIIEVLNDTDIIVDVPYVDSSGNVAPFSGEAFSVSYQDIENETVGETSITGSFAKIDITQLKTFVGDVARVKIFRKSRNAVGDFAFVQEAKLESQELLRDITTSGDTEVFFGKFTNSNLSNYWVSSSNDHPISVDSSVLSRAAHIDYNTSAGGVQQLITSQSISLSSGVEYTLDFKTLLSGSLSDENKNVRAFLSSSNFTQDFLTISGSAIYRAKQDVTKNIISQNTGDAKLVFEVKGDDWFISNVSLRNAQDTSFSPDEFTIIQDIPRKTATETFDFRFEFYDVNNNFIPVRVEATKEFDGGNDFPTSGKLLTFESDRNAFRFSSGSVQNPTGQQIQLKVSSQNLTGSVTFASSAFDVDGNYLNPSDYTQYPGKLTSVTTAGALVTINNFTGSRTDGLETPYVGSVVYTASLENQEEFETVYRLEDGDNAPQLIVTSNANQFVYEPTSLSPKPAGQSITIRAQRKNLASLVTPLTINSGSNKPELTYVSTTNGIDTYTISSTAFSQSFSANSFDEVTYSFTGSDVFGNNQTDEITLSKVVNFDGVSVVLSNESTAFKSDSTGTVTAAEFNEGDGTVDVRVGSNVISHSEGLSTKNTFDIISVTASTGLTANSTTPTTNSYGISAMTTNTGSLELLVRYKAGDNSTTVDFTKFVSYTKAKDATPNVVVAANPTAQAINANSLGSGSQTPLDVDLTALEGGVSRFSSAGSPTFTGGLNGSVSSQTLSFSSNATSMTADIGKVTIPITFSDSEGTTGTKNVEVTVSRIKAPTPVISVNLNPQSQTVDANSTFSSVGTPSNVTLSINEGGSDYTYTTGTVTANKFKITGVSAGTNNNNGTITPTTPTDATGTTTTITFSYTNSEGTEFTGKTITASVGVAVQGQDGNDGASGVVITQNIDSQVVPVSTSGTYGTPVSASVTGTEGATTYVYDDSSPYTSGSFYIDNVSGGTNNNDGTVTPTTPSSAAGTTMTYDVNYLSNSGSANTISFTHRVSVSLDGQTGPGVVHTGVWEPSRIYQYADGLSSGQGRRDTVLWSSGGSAPYDTYYAATRQHTSAASSGTNSAEGAPHQSNSTAWVSLGTQDLFVAAKIGLFEDSFIDSTLNIGASSTSFSTANITLASNSGSPYFSLGQASAGVYNANGIFIGEDSSAYKLSLKSGTNSLLWDGTNLITSGSGEFSGNLAAATGTFSGKITAGTIEIGNNVNGTTDDGIYIDANNYWLSDDTFHVGDGTDYMEWDGSTLSVSGDLDASGGTITGATLVGGEISVPNTSSPLFEVNSTGQLTATSANISGTLNSTSGNIGGWEISTNAIFSPASTTANRMYLGAGGTPVLNVYDSSGALAVDINTNSSLTSLGSGTGSPGSTTVNQEFSINGVTYTLPSCTGTTQYINYMSTTAGHSSTKYATSSGNYTSFVAGQAGSTTVEATFDHSGTSLTYMIKQDYPTGRINFWSANWTAGFIVTTNLSSPASGQVGSASNMFMDGASPSSGTTLYGPTYAQTNTISVSFNAVNGTTYYIVPFISTINDSVVLNSCFSFTGNASIYVRTPRFININTSASVSRTEITAGGMQVVNSTSNYVEMERQAGSTGSSTVMVKVGGAIEATGNITANTSDKRLKDIKGKILNPLQKIEKLNGILYDYNDLAKSFNLEALNQQVGLIAQEVEEVLPEAVTRAPFDTEKDIEGKPTLSKSGDNYLTIWYDKIVPLLVEGIKELKEKVEKLEEDNKTLKGE